MYVVYEIDKQMYMIKITKQWCVESYYLRLNIIYKFLSKDFSSPLYNYAILNRRKGKKKSCFLG